MVARDDSVIRGSLIASLIFLVLSFALNFFLWRWGDTQAADADRATAQLTNAQNELRRRTSQVDLMKVMLGVGDASGANVEQLKSSISGDADMEAIERRFVQDMAYFGPEVDDQNRNYPALPEFLVNAIRSRNDQVVQGRDDVTNIRSQADSDIDNARKAQSQAEATRDSTIAKLEKAMEEFTEDRNKMKLAGESMKDELTTNVRDFQAFRKTASDEKAQLVTQATQLRGTIETQRQELNRLRSDRFETVQGEISYVIPPGNLVQINLGSADSLRAGVQFGVVAADEVNLADAPVKATVEVTKVRGEHFSEARVVGPPSYRNPLIRGDKIYSPFWQPGRKVRIALAGDIDIDGDGRSDVEELRSMIERAGAEVAAVLSADGSEEGKLDSSVRFLVMGEPRDADSSRDSEVNDANNQFIVKLGEYKARAIELGITPIPAWKLQAYMKAINDSVTTPLGSAVRGEDFPPESNIGEASRRSGANQRQIYENQIEAQQRRN